MSDAPPRSGIGKVGGVVGHEIKSLLPPLIFFFFGLNLITLSKHLVGQSDIVLYVDFIKATIGALVIAKVVLIVDYVPLIGKVHGRPLIAPILYRSIIYTAFAMLIHVLEELIRGWVIDGSWTASIAAWTAGFHWQIFAFIGIWVFALFLVYIAFDEVRKDYTLPRFWRILIQPEKSP